MLNNQWPLVTEHELELFQFMIRVRYVNKLNVNGSDTSVFFISADSLTGFSQILEGTNAIRDALTIAVDPISGLTTSNECLLAFLPESAPSPSLEIVRTNSWAFGLIGMAKFAMRLPADILTEELPRLKGTLTTVRFRPCQKIHT